MKEAKHISFCSDTIDLYTQTCIALKLLEIPYQGAIKTVENPIRRPHFLTTQWTIIVHNDNAETVKELLAIANPIIKCSIKNGHFAERLQRKNTVKL